MPRSRAQTAHLSENAPETTASTRSGARFRSAASHSPVAAAVAVKQKPSRPKDLLEARGDVPVEILERLAAVPDGLVRHGLAHAVAHPHGARAGRSAPARDGRRSSRKA